METAVQLKNILGENLRENVVLRDHVSIGVGGVADFFFVAKDIASLTEAVSAASKLKVPYFVLGGGNNIIPSDQGFPGLVIKNASSNIIFSPDFSTVIVDSGVSLARLINQAASHDLGGLEFLFGVPSTIGGAIYGNAGAFKYSIGDFVKSVTLLVSTGNELKIEKHSQSWMEFSYRSSKLKNDFEPGKKPIILTATLQLVQRRKDEILRMMQDNLAWKKKNQPMNELSAGSFFRNIGDPVIGGPEKTAGYLLDKAGAKRLRVGGASFSKKHANFLINHKKATATDVRNLAEQAKELVREKFDYDLNEEVEYIGKW